MSTHQDWLNAKARRDDAAYMLAKSFIARNTADCVRQAEKFQAADDEMARLEKELDS